MRYYVYELVDPRDRSVFYVGKGCDSRIDAHESEARKGRVSRKCDRIREIEAAGLSVVKRKVASFEQEQAAFDYEDELICSYGLATLTNVIPGGGAARGGHTVRGDRSFTYAVAEFFNRTKGGQIAGLYVSGRYLDLQAIAKDYLGRIAEIAHRRGTDWVNANAVRFGVSFSYAA